MNKPALQHRPETEFTVDSDNLIFAGKSLLQLAQLAGQTPFYAYSRSLMTERVRQLRRNMPDDLKIHYAIKANPMPAVVQHMANIVDGLDVASANEMLVALDTGMRAENISMAGPGKRPLELLQAIAAGITIHVESMQELETIAGQCEQSGQTAHIAIRINPAFELKSSGMKMGGGAKQFGIDEERVPSALQRIEELRLDFKGFHIFSGSQNLKPEAIIEAQQKSIALVVRLSDICPAPILKLNIGGGFGIPYFPGEMPLDSKRIGEALAESMLSARDNIPEAEIIIELGRYLVGEAGLYVTRIIDKKISRGQTFLVTDGGLNHHLAASGNFGQVIRKNYPVAIGNKMACPEMETVNIVGPLCTPLDILADKMELPRAEIGDLVVIFQSGAYGFTASPRDFLNQPGALQLLL